MKVTYKGKPVANPYAKAFIIFFVAPLVLCVAFLATIVLVVVVVGFAPIWIPAHFILRKMGRKGFMRNGGTKIAIDSEAFRKR